MSGYGSAPAADAKGHDAAAATEHYTDAELPAVLLARAAEVCERLGKQTGRKAGEYLHVLQHKLPHLWPAHSHGGKAAATAGAAAAAAPKLYAIPPYTGSLAALVDHTVLKPEAQGKEVDALCAEAVTYGFAAVCVNPTRVAGAKQALAAAAKANPKAAAAVGLCAVVGFPLGANTTATKLAEARELLTRGGCTEIDMVLNVGALKERDYALVLSDIAALAAVARNKKRVLKVIFECSLLTATEMIDASLLSVLAGAHFVKTSTGFGASGAKARDVRLMRLTVGDAARVKASGGIRDAAAAKAMVDAGALRIGTSAGVAIAKAEAKAKANTAESLPSKL